MGHLGRVGEMETNVKGERGMRQARIRDGGIKEALEI